MTTLDHITRPDQLVLARLLVPTKGGLTAAKIASDLSKLDAERFSRDHVAAALENLCSHGHVETLPSAKKPPPKKRPPGPKPPAYALTAKGQDLVLSSIGLPRLPSKLSWATLVESLLRVAIGAAPQTPLKTKPTLAAYLIRRQLALDVPEGSKLSTVIAAVVCKTLGFPGVSDYKALETRVLEKSIGTPGLNPKNATEQFIRSQLGSKQGKIDEIRRSALRQWLSVASPTRIESAAPDRHATTAAHLRDPNGAHDGGEASLADFALSAVDAARRSHTGRFGDNKVFISHAWKNYTRGGDRSDLDLPQFKQQLLLANTAGLLELSRADLVALMDETDVRDSETPYLNTSFHFILLEKGHQ